MQLGQLQKIQPELIALGYQILAVSPDRPEKLRATVKKHTLDYVLLSDSRMEAARSLGIAYRVDDATNARLKGFGIDLEKASGEKHGILPVPSVFLIGTDGVVEFLYSNPDNSVRIQTEALLEAAGSMPGREAQR